MKRIAIIVSLSTCGCGLQVASGPAWTVDDKAKPTVSAGVALAPERNSTTVVGAKLVTVYDDGFVVRSGILHGGYDWVAIPGWLTYEPIGLDLGVGQPVNRRYGGTGAYGGASSNLRVRLGDNPARHREFSIVHFVWLPPEIVLTPHAGWWSSPEQYRPTGLDFEFGVELGLRLVLGSDFVSGAQGQPAHDREMPPDPTPATPSSKTNGGTP